MCQRSLHTAACILTVYGRRSVATRNQEALHNISLRLRTRTQLFVYKLVYHVLLDTRHLNTLGVITHQSDAGADNRCAAREGILVRANGCEESHGVRFKYSRLGWFARRDSFRVLEGAERWWCDGNVELGLGRADFGGKSNLVEPQHSSCHIMMYHT